MALIAEVISGVSEFLGFEIGVQEVLRRGYEGDKHFWRHRKLAKKANYLRHDSLAVLKEPLSFNWTDIRKRIFFRKPVYEVQVPLLCDKNNNRYFT